MKVSQSRGEEAWVTLLDGLWDREVSPDSGVRWVICDGDLAIEAAVEIAYPGVRIQRCIWHLLRNAQSLLERRYLHGREAQRRNQLMRKVREILTAPSKEEAYARFKALAQKDGLLARYLWPQLKKGIEYLRKSGRGAHLLPPGWREPSGSIEGGPSLWMVLRRIVGRRTSTIYGWQRKEPRRMVRTGYARL